VIIQRILNNNVVIVKNKKGQEEIVCGKGIAFKKKVGEFVDVSAINKVFTLRGRKELEYFQELWEEEARRYYLNIVGKYGLQVQNVLKKAKMLDIQMICPLHGPVLNNHLDEYIHHYCLWSQYQPEESGVLIAYASIHGNTKDAVMYLAHLLEMQGETVVMHDLCRTDVSYVVADAFRYDRLILASSSYDGGVFCPMETLLHHLKSKNFQNRDIALIENGTWAPSAIKAMNEILEPMKNIHIMEPTVTIRSTLSEKNKAEFQILIKSIMEGGCKDEICV